MGFKKCPICEVNYIKDDESCCDVCKRYKKGEPDNDADDVITMCIECGENPAVKGRELCSTCLRESLRQEKLSEGTAELDPGAVVLPDVELMEVEVPMTGDSDIPESELEVIHKELGGDDDLSDDDDIEEDRFDDDFKDEEE